MSKRKHVGRALGVLMSFIFVFTTVFGLGGVSAKAEEASKGNTLNLYIQDDDKGDTLYVDLWGKAFGLASDDANEQSHDFGWDHTQTKLKKLSVGKNLYLVKLTVDSSLVSDSGIDIYANDSKTKKAPLSEWTNKDLYNQLTSMSGDVVFDIPSWKISDDISAYRIESKKDDDQKEPEIELGQAVTDSIRGGDISSYISIQNAFDQMNADRYQGRTDWGYKDFDGKIIRNQDFFNFLAAQGMNWVRIRIWNDPYDANGNGYGGGDSDLAKAITMGKWATNAGMKVLIDFHYSDGWADPSRQTAPKAWKSFNGDPDKTAAAVAEFTTDSLNQLIAAGVDVEMVQVGNETNNGIAGVKATGNWTENADKVYKAGVDAVHSVKGLNGQQILAAVHFTDPQDAGKQLGYAANLAAGEVDYDVFATSAYPFWHGTADSIKKGLSQIAQKYNKQVMVAETSYANTLTELDGFDDNTVRAGKNDTGDALIYPFTQDGQAKQFRNLANAVSSITYSDGKTSAGWGAFYWEAAWNGLVDTSNMSDSEKAEAVAYEQNLWSRYGCGWASKYAAEYDVQADASASGGAVIENQSFFGADGKALNSIRTFASDYDPSTETIKEDLTVEKIDADDSVIVLDPTESLSADELGNAAVYYTNGSKANLDIEWNNDQISEYNEGRNTAKNYGKTFTIEGTVAGKTVSRQVKLRYPDILSNGNFETGDTTGWTVKDGSAGGTVESSVGNNTYKGKYSLHFWAQSDFTYEISQNVTVTEPGMYKLSMVTQGALKETDDYVYLRASVNGKDKETKDTLGGWQSWKTPSVDDINITQDMINAHQNVITVTAGISGTAESWGDFDEIRLEKIGEAVAEDHSTSGGSSSSDTGSTVVTPQEPEQKPSEPEKKPEEPEKKPQTPDEKPKTPDTKPSEPEKEANTIKTTDNGKMKVVDENGKAVKNEIVTVEGKTYATKKDGTVAVDQSVKIDGKKYIATEDGTLADKGIVKADNKTFVVKDDQTVASSETVKIGKYTYVAKKNGTLAKKTIVKTDDGTKYYADKNGRIVKNEVVKVAGKKYITDDKGRIITGKWVTKGNKKYYCSKSGKITKTVKVKKHKK